MDGGKEGEVSGVGGWVLWTEVVLEPGGVTVGRWI